MQPPFTHAEVVLASSCIVSMAATGLHYAQTPLVVCNYCRVSVVGADLSDHYLSSSAHPKCVPCNIGFADIADYNIVSPSR